MYGIFHIHPASVGEFRKLAILAEQDGHLRQRLQQILKLSKEKWEEARDHAMRAVVADNRMRIWYADNSSMELGLLFTCRLGNIDLERPVGMWVFGVVSLVCPGATKKDSKNTDDGCYYSCCKHLLHTPHHLPRRLAAEKGTRRCTDNHGSHPHGTADAQPTGTSSQPTAPSSCCMVGRWAPRVGHSPPRL